MLREDFFPFIDEVPYYVKKRFGVAASGSVLIKWIYDEYDLYPEEKKATKKKKDDEYETDNEEVEEGNIGVDGYEKKKNDNGRKNDGTSVNNDNNNNEETAESNRSDGGAAAHWTEPSEEYNRRVEEYYNWVIYKPEELPDVQFPWEVEENQEATGGTSSNENSAEASS
ncbi:hypothetical protein PGQ11_009889 [Apiospora arundinis]|uniref:Uncharacterized protein n=1 Tax=Apiospora arundinis TaxID=335852 RepID=A0ABR2I9T5_9PEZI